MKHSIGSPAVPGSCGRRLASIARVLAATKVPLVLVAVEFVVAGCSGDEVGCIGAVGHDGGTYVEVGFSTHHGGLLADEGEMVSCDVVRDEGVTKAFDKSPVSVDVYSVPGFDADDVIAVKVTGKAWSVLVKESQASSLTEQVRKAGLLNAGQA